MKEMFELPLFELVSQAHRTVFELRRQFGRRALPCRSRTSLEARHGVRMCVFVPQPSRCLLRSSAWFKSGLRPTRVSESEAGTA